MSERNVPQAVPSTATPTIDLVGLTGLARAITTTLLQARLTVFGHRAPRDRSAASIRTDVRAGKQQPIRALLRLNLADIDDGVPVALVNQYLADMMAQNVAYAARKQTREGSAGALSFTVRFNRTRTRELLAQYQSDRSTLQLDVDSIDSLEQARTDLRRYDEPQQEMDELLTARIAELRMAALTP